MIKLIRVMGKRSFGIATVKMTNQEGSLITE